MSPVGSVAVAVKAPGPETKNWSENEAWPVPSVVIDITPRKFEYSREVDASAATSCKKSIRYFVLAALSRVATITTDVPSALLVTTAEVMTGVACQLFGPDSPGV